MMRGQQNIKNETAVYRIPDGWCSGSALYFKRSYFNHFFYSSMKPLA
jgi:hypothetical protein